MKFVYNFSHLLSSFLYFNHKIVIKRQKTTYKINLWQILRFMAKFQKSSTHAHKWMARDCDDNGHMTL